MLDKEDPQKLIISQDSINVRLQTNNIINQKRNFNLIWAHALTQVQMCLKADAEEFDYKHYSQEIKKLTTQIQTGTAILEEIEKWAISISEWWTINEEKTLKLKEDTKRRLEQLKTDKDKLENFINKVPLIQEYQKDIQNYTTEILEILDILQ